MLNRRFGNLEFTSECYKEFILNRDSVPSKYFNRQAIARFSKQALQAHTYCVAKTRSGKTELLKVVIHRLIEHKDKQTSLFILDPHGEMARELRRLKIVKEHLEDIIYIDASIDDQHVPVFNPFELKQKDEASLAYMTDAFLEAFQQLLKDQAITGNMKRLLRHLIYVLLTAKDTTMMDLMILLSGISRNRNKKEPDFIPQEETLMNFGRESSDPLTRRFFQYGWKEVDSRTITAVIERVDSILSHPLVRNFIIGKNSIDLESYLNSGKIVIVNLDFTKLGNIGSEAIGRLMISAAQNISAKRNSLKRTERPQTLIFIDECQRFVSSAIEKALSEFAKFNTYLWLSHQYIEQIDEGMLKGMLSNTENKIIGRNSSATLGALSSETNVPKEELMQIKKYQFIVKIGDKDSVLIQSDSSLLDEPESSYYLTEEQAQKEIDPYMIKKYYRHKKKNIYTFTQENIENYENRKVGKEQSGLRVRIDNDDF